MSKLTGPRRYAELSSTTTSYPSDTSTSTTSPFQNQPEVNKPQTSTNYYNQQPANGYYQDNGVVNEASAYNSTPAPTKAPPSARKSSKNQAIDTDKIPRPDIHAESSYTPMNYQTSSGNNPPHSFTNYITIDDGNAGPRYLRSTFYKVPTEESLIKNTHIPISLIIQPLADPSPEEEAVPVMDYGEAGPFRCNRCQAYVNPNWSFKKNGSVVVCNICKMVNDVPQEYYSPLNADGTRMDRLEKPELSKGVYEFIAPSGYHQRALVTPNILICIEASSTSYLSGIFHQIFSSLQSLLDYIPSPELTKICIATYDTGINFFKVPDDLTKEVSITHISDIDASCLPYPKSYFFLSLQDERDKINYLMERILKYYENNEKLQKGVYGTCLGAALVDCCDILLKDGGRVMVFSTQAPVAGLGKIKRRDDPKLYGTEKEKTLYVPQTEEYHAWATKCLEKRVSVDLFCFAPEYFDLVTIGQLSNMTGGNIYYYPNYKPTHDSERLHYDIARNLTRYVGYDVIMTIRACQGISFQEYAVPAGKKTEAQLEISTLDADTAITAYLKHDEKITEDNVTFQIAVLYTNPYGQRVIRVLNFKTPTSSDLVAIFRSCDVEAVAQATIKRVVTSLPTSSVAHLRKTLLDTLVNILYNYRYHCATNSSQSQLILPEALKTLPMYFLAAFKSNVLRPGHDVKLDFRADDLYKFTKYALNVISNMLYPKVYPLHTIWVDDELAPGNIVENRTVLGYNVAASAERIDDDGMYLIDNGETLYIYVKRNVDPLYFQHLFGVELYQEVAQLTSMPEYIESEYFTKVSNIIELLRRNKNGAYQNVRIVTEKDPIEQQLLNLLVEDERLGESYSAFLCNVHKLINDKFM